MNDYVASIYQNSVVVNEKYLNWYCNLIDKRILQPICDGYSERHHIIPRSFGGTDDHNNVVQLSGREHFIAHLLLAKATSSPKMIKALHKMVFSFKPGTDRYRTMSSHTYNYLRKQHAYYYTKGSERYHKFNFRHSRLPKLLGDLYDPSKVKRKIQKQVTGFKYSIAASNDG